MRRTHAVTVRTAPWSYDGWIARKDVVTAARLGCCLMAALLPSRLWPAAARLLARVHLKFHAGAVELLAASSACESCGAASFAHEAIAADYLSDIGAVAEALPGRSGCESRLVGGDVLARALQRTRGAIVWYSPFAGSDLASKKALALAGYPVTQLSSPFHPYSPTRLGALLLNPIRLRAINRYTATRVLVVYGNARPALDALKAVLADNGVVLITAIGAGRHSLAFPLMGGVVELAVGAPLLACDSGAALIPAFTLPDAGGGYRFELAPELTPPRSASSREAIRDLAARYVDLLEPVVRAHPAQWEGWFHPGTWMPAK